jgi:hypothetical protein
LIYDPPASPLMRLGTLSHKGRGERSRLSRDDSHPRNSPRVAPFHFHLQPRNTIMVIGVTHLAPIVALIAGIAILLVPRLLNFIVAAYLIIVGVLGLGLIH